MDYLKLTSIIIPIELDTMSKFGKKFNIRIYEERFNSIETKHKASKTKPMPNAHRIRHNVCFASKLYNHAQRHGAISHFKHSK